MGEIKNEGSLQRAVVFAKRISPTWCKCAQWLGDNYDELSDLSPYYIEECGENLGVALCDHDTLLMLMEPTDWLIVYDEHDIVDVVKNDQFEREFEVV